MAALLARAFAADPAFAYVFPDPADRARRLPRLFRLAFDSDMTAGMCLVTGGGEAATLWRGPGRAKIGAAELLRSFAPLLASVGWAARRAAHVSEAIETNMPARPCWYLHVAGCDPARQGGGHGRAAVEAGLDRVAGRLPCHLETANPDNLGFYQGLGFAVTAEWRVGMDGPCFWSMLRPPG